MRIIALSNFSLMSNFTTNSTDTRSNSWTTHIELARMAYERGLYLAASRHYIRGLTAAESLGMKDEDLVEAHLGMAKCFCELGRFSEAEELYKHVLKIDQTALQSKCLSLAVDYNDLAKLYLKTDQFAQAEELLNKSLAITAGLTGNNKELVAEAEKDLAHLYYKRDLLPEATQHIERAYTICDTTNKLRDTKLFSEVLLIMGLLEAKKGLFNDAEEHIEKAITNFEFITGGQHPELADFLDIAADLFQLENLPDKAMELKERASSIRKRIRKLDR